MAKSVEELVSEGYTQKQAEAIVNARKKKESDGDNTIAGNTKKKNDALNQIYNW